MLSRNMILPAEDELKFSIPRLYIPKKRHKTLKPGMLVYLKDATDLPFYMRFAIVVFHRSLISTYLTNGYNVAADEVVALTMVAL